MSRRKAWVCLDGRGGTEKLKRYFFIVIPLKNGCGESSTTKFKTTSEIKSGKKEGRNDFSYLM